MNKHVEKKDNILIDLSELNFIDSTSLGILVVFLKKKKKNNRNFALLNINPDIMQMFKITGLDKRIRIFISIDEAMSAFGTA